MIFTISVSHTFTIPKKCPPPPPWPPKHKILYETRNIIHALCNTQSYTVTHLLNMPPKPGNTMFLLRNQNQAYGILQVLSYAHNTRCGNTTLVYELSVGKVCLYLIRQVLVCTCAYLLMSSVHGNQFRVTAIP